jgi:hypothetical protein
MAVVNDGPRWTFCRSKVVITAAVAAFAQATLRQLLEQVRHFDEFVRDTICPGEPDFGRLDLASVRYVFMIYYCPRCTAAWKMASDPEKTTRVLTVVGTDED